MYDKSGKLVDRREMLRIKVNSLMAEAWIIRAAEHKQKGFAAKRAVPDPILYQEMHQHRTLPLRREARLTALALGFIRGRTLEQMEAKTYRPLTEGDWKEINAMLKKYGPAGLAVTPSYVAQHSHAGSEARTVTTVAVAA